MPLARIALRRGKSAEYKAAIVDGIYRAMRETFNVPENDKFMLIDEYDAEHFHFDPMYGGVHRGDDLVIIQITANNTRTIEQKKAFFAHLAKILSHNPGVRKEDVFINLVEVVKENWSFGNGIAQYAS